MDHRKVPASPGPISPAKRPLTGDPQLDNSYAAQAGGGVFLLALARGLRTPGRARTISVVFVGVVVLAIVGFVLASLV